MRAAIYKQLGLAGLNYKTSAISGKGCTGWDWDCCKDWSAVVGHCNHCTDRAVTDSSDCRSLRIGSDGPSNLHQIQLTVHITLVLVALPSPVPLVPVLEIPCSVALIISALVTIVLRGSLLSAVLVVPLVLITAIEVTGRRLGTA